MSYSSITFDKSRLILARQLAGVRKSELALKIGVSPSTITTWESGSRSPEKDESIHALAQALSVPASFFQVGSIDEKVGSVGTPHFRSLRGTTQVQRDQANAYAHLVLDVVKTLTKYINLPDRILPEIPTEPDIKNSIVPEFAAQQVRSEWGLKPGPIPHMVREIEKHGVVVVFSPSQSKNIDAYSVDSGKNPVVILHPLKEDYYRQRFDVAHELGHLVMHTDAEPGNKTIEAQAHAFAAELLMPKAHIFHELPTRMDQVGWMKLKELKENWGVSMQALLHRAKSLGRLSEASYRNAMVKIAKHGWRVKEPGVVNNIEQPSLLPQGIEILEDEGGLPREIIQEISQVPREYFDTIISRVPYTQRY